MCYPNAQGFRASATQCTHQLRTHLDAGIHVSAMRAQLMRASLSRI
jgi:kynurenine formamidase